MDNVYVFNIGSICIHWKELLRKFSFHQKYREQSHDETDVRHIWKSDEIFGVTPINWEDSSWKQLSLVIDEEVINQSLACKGLRIPRFCVMSWKGESEPNMKFCLGRKIELVQEFITIQNFGHNWWWADGIRVEYFPGFTTLQLCNEVQEFMSKMSGPSEFKGRIIFMSMFNDI